MSEFATQHTDNMRVAQSRILFGDSRFFVETANGYVVRGPYVLREDADEALERLREGLRDELRGDE